MKKIYLSIALVLLLAMTIVSFAKANAVAVQVPLKGTIQGVETHVVNFPSVYIDGSGTGNATMLGGFSFHYSGVVDLRTATSTGLSTQLMAANGDMLYAEGYGQARLTPEISYVTEWYTITGGTGRFEGASGSFTLTRQVNRATGNLSGELDGMIILLEGQ